MRLNRHKLPASQKLSNSRRLESISCEISAYKFYDSDKFLLLSHVLRPAHREPDQKYRLERRDTLWAKCPIDLARFCSRWRFYVMLFQVRLYACYLCSCFIFFEADSCGVKEALIISWSNRAMPQPATSTDRLANVIQVIQLGRKTGTLTAERDGNNGLEQGIIFFVNGQVARASAQHLEGTAAFRWLNTWSACRFTFAPSISPATTVKLPAVPPESIPDHGTSGNAASPRGGNGWVRPEARIPFQYRALDEALRSIEQAHLSRAHRRLYLLIDGHRSPAELARLMGRGQHEIDALLHDLERTGVIRR